MGGAGRETGAAYGVRGNLKFFASLFFKKATGVARGETPARIWSHFKGSVADRYAFGDLAKAALCGRPGWPQFCFAKTERTCCKNVAQLVEAGIGNRPAKLPQAASKGRYGMAWIKFTNPLCFAAQRAFSAMILCFPAGPILGLRPLDWRIPAPISTDRSYKSHLPKTLENI